MRNHRPSNANTDRWSRSPRVGVAAALLALTALVACSDDERVSAPTDAPVVVSTEAPSAGTTAVPTSSEAVETTDGAPTTSDAEVATTIADASAVSADALAWALEYTGGSARAASGEPIVIGVADSALYPADPYTTAMADFITAELGGIDGRPIEIVTCDGVIDPAGCAERLAGDPAVVAVLENVPSPEKNEFLETVGDRKPILTVDPSSGTDAVSFFTGHLQVLSATGLAAAAILPDGAGKIAVIGGPGTDVVTQDAAALVAPDAELVLVSTDDIVNGVSENVGDLAAAIEAVGASDASVVLVYTPAACEAAAGAYEQLGQQPTFVWAYWCQGEDGYVVGDQIDFSGPDVASGELAVVEGVEGYLAGPADLTVEGGYLLWPAADLLRIARVLNDVGAGAGVDDVQAALKAYDGPALLGVGNADCSVVPPTLVSAPGACTTLVEVSLRTRGALEPAEPADLNR